jgi:DNA recombination-dependent growth factor C
MSFEKGKINFAVVEFIDGIDRDTFIANVLSESYTDTPPSIEEPVIDFTSGVSLANPRQEEETDEDDFILGGLPYFAIRKQELKIDSAIVKETLDRRLFDLEKEGTKITSAIKGDTKEMVVDSLADMAVQKISGVRCVITVDGKRMLVDATSPKKVDETVIESILTSIETGAFGSSNAVTRLTPEFLYLTTTGKSYDSYCPVKMNNFETNDGIGHDFMTYLFMGSEVENFFDPGVELTFSGNIELEDCRECLSGAKKTVLKDGAPAMSDEVVSALQSGKKVKSADIMVTFGGDTYSVTIDKDFTFKKFSVEDPEEGLDIHSQFETRVNTAAMFLDGFKKLFAKFVSTEENNERMILTWLREKQSTVSSPLL